MGPEVKVIIMVICFLGFLSAGVPIVFILGGLSVIFTGLFWGTVGWTMIGSNVFDVLSTPTLFALPLFLFMGNMLRYTGIGDELFEAIYGWMGGIRGGLAVGTVVICTFFAAMTGVAGAATVTMAVIAMPAMEKRGYHKNIYVGSIAAGGLLGLLIPPSIEMILYSVVVPEVSLGRMYIAGLIPGLIMSALFVVYILVACNLNPSWGPAVKEKISWSYRFRLLRKMILPSTLVFVILGGIYAGIFTPTEASGIGVGGVMIMAVIRGKLNYSTVSQASFDTLKLSAMIFWLIIAASCFSMTITVTGVGKWLTTAVTGMNLPMMYTIIAFMIILFIMGMFMSDTAIVLLFAPIAGPIMAAFGVDSLWWGMLFIISMIIAWITPPYGTILFLVKQLTPEGITMGDIYRSIVPFCICMLLTLVLCMIFPGIITWLPEVVLG